MSDKIFDIDIVPGRATIGHTVIQCCGKDVQQDWEYCPYCGESIVWPLSEEEKAQRQREHDERMASDPLYKVRWEEKERLAGIFLGPRWDAAVSDFASAPLPINMIKAPRAPVGTLGEDGELHMGSSIE